MSDRYKYTIENGCFAVYDNEKGKQKILTNFTAKITSEELHILNNGKKEFHYYIEGKTHDGQILDSIKLSVEEYEKGKWFRINWGGKAELHDLDDAQNKALKHLSRAIYKLSNHPIQTKTIYERTGLVTDSSATPYYLFGNGAVTADGIDKNYCCKLPEQLEFIKLPESIPNHEETKKAIRDVFNLLQFSEKNPYLGLVLCLAAIRASTSIFMPIRHWFFLVGRKGTFKSSIAEIILSFFGPFNNNHALTSWNATATALENLALIAKNCVFCVDDFVYPEVSNRKHEFTKKAEEFLRAVANGSAKSRSNDLGRGVESTTALNCMLISTGEFAPRHVPESLHERGIYIPFEVGDIEKQALDTIQDLAMQGIFANANVAFIRYLLNDFPRNSNRAEKWLKQAIKLSTDKFELNHRAANHMAGLMVAWAFFRKFAVHQGVITEDQSKIYRKQMNQHLKSLMDKQKDIYSYSTGSLLFKGLKEALNDGRAYVKDASTGKQPSDVDPSRVGWQKNKPKGIWLGWRCDKKGEVFIRGDLGIHELISLLPMHDQNLFPKGEKKFWKELKDQKKLKSYEKGRNTTRKSFAGSTCKNNYHLTLKIKDEPKVDKSSTTKPKVSKSEPTSPKTNSNQKSPKNSLIKKK